MNRPQDISKSSEATQGRNGDRPEGLTTPRSEYQSKLRDYMAIYDPELDRAKPKTGNQVIYRFNGEVKPGVSMFAAIFSESILLNCHGLQVAILAYHIWQLVYDSHILFIAFNSSSLLFPRKFLYIHLIHAQVC
jgi:hypothetical protein